MTLERIKSACLRWQWDHLSLGEDWHTCSHSLIVGRLELTLSLQYSWGVLHSIREWCSLNLLQKIMPSANINTLMITSSTMHDIHWNTSLSSPQCDTLLNAIKKGSYFHWCNVYIEVTLSQQTTTKNSLDSLGHPQFSTLTSSFADFAWFAKRETSTIPSICKIKGKQFFLRLPLQIA